MPHVTKGPVVVLAEGTLARVIAAVAETGHPAACGATIHDGGDVFAISGQSGESVRVCRTDAVKGTESESAAILLTVDTDPNARGQQVRDLEGRAYVVLAHQLSNGSLKPVHCVVVPRNADVFDRVRGVFETDVLRSRSVCIFGVGSGGSFVARELAKAGVGTFTLVDSDRLELGNVCRHECGIRDIGRLKVNSVAEMIRNHSPAARIATSQCHIAGDTAEEVRSLVRGADLVICGTDNRESRLIVNRMAVQEGKTAIFGGVFLRAVGGQVLRVIPGQTPCYQCFVSAIPEEASNNEVSSADDAARLSYTDRPMPIEPGLSSDLMPVALQIVKLAIVELLRGCDTTLSSLREDLAMPWYLWVNRRDPRTVYANWLPLVDDLDGMRILRWYGIGLPKLPACPACGELGDNDGLDVTFFES
jgi:molybdopterin/thiamine biosynthesis adenylyltransferase